MLVVKNRSASYVLDVTVHFSPHLDVACVHKPVTTHVHPYFVCSYSNFVACIDLSSVHTSRVTMENAGKAKDGSVKKEPLSIREFFAPSPKNAKQPPAEGPGVAKRAADETPAAPPAKVANARKPPLSCATFARPAAKVAKAGKTGPDAKGPPAKNAKAPPPKKEGPPPAEVPPADGPPPPKEPPAEEPPAEEPPAEGPPSAKEPPAKDAKAPPPKKEGPPRAKGPPAKEPTPAPPSSKADATRVSASASAALGAAQAEVKAAEMSAAERKSLWMQHLRTRQSGKAGGRSAKGSTLRSSKPSSEMLEKAQCNPNKYFELWLECDKDWGEVEVIKRKRDTNTTQTQGEQRWMLAKDMDDYFGKTAALALRNEPRGTEDHKPHPQCSDERLDQWNCITVVGSTIRTAISASEQERITRGALSKAPSSILAAAMAADDQDDPTSVSSGPGPAKDLRTPEEIAAEEEDKQRRKEELRMARLESEHLIRAWLHSLPKDIQKMKAAKVQIAKASVPTEVKDEYDTQIDKHVDELSQWRDRLEDAAAMQQYDVQLKQDRVAVARAQAAIVSWEKILEIHDPDSIPKKKQKTSASGSK